MMRARMVVATLASVLAGVIGPQLAVGDHWWWDSGGNIVHLNRGHTPGLSFYNKANNGSSTALEHARGEWSANWAIDMGNLASNNADVVAWDGRWCGIGWSGLATPGAWLGTGGHFNQGWVQINVCGDSRAANANYRGTRAVACQEIGHVIGGTLHRGPGCMGFGYQGQVPAGSNTTSDERVLHPDAHDFDHLQHLWAGLH